MLNQLQVRNFSALSTIVSWGFTFVANLAGIFWAILGTAIFGALLWLGRKIYIWAVQNNQDIDKRRR